ncbi:S41 family peptidase [Streptomyces reniochalinae]|uniref:S41 family peptidase n=1 Tax=Streptomyces reniochalinae TaxID=2250578 RepID=UPI001FE6C712|nr:S41 family peptidase [Streptomyces reniochalinae]
MSGTRRVAARVGVPAVVGVLVVAGCGPSRPATSSAPAHAASHTAGRVAGLWRMDGYGLLVTVGKGKLRTYETTRTSCLPGTLRGTERTPGRRAGAAAVSGTRTYDVADAAPVTLEPRGAGEARLRFADGVGWRTLHRITELPRRCAQKPEDDPRAVFDVFWRTYAENYPFFARRGVDWQAARARWRPKVTRDTSDARLFAILRAMIAPLHDAHTALIAGERRYAGRRQGTPAPTPQSIARIDKATSRAVGVPLHTWGQGAVSFADLPDGTGYLRLTRLQDLTDKGDFAGDTRTMDKALDKVFTAHRVRRMKGLIVDVRFHAGGSDRLGLRVAARLTDRAYRAYAKRARNDPADPRGFTAEQPVTVRPHHGPVFTGPVAVLTGRLTVSAGETFTQALLDRRSAPVLIGENTQGVFSDTMERSLPGGWSFVLPNEEFRTRGGRTFDVTGIPPRHRTPVFTEEEFAHHRDSALGLARHLLGGRRPEG